ncbi:MAG: hypothetical protein HKN26_17380 [Acidimicrobiales bacterium]|nr:hypothetical protein [Acidimicrobiales bacterium]
MTDSDTATETPVTEFMHVTDAAVLKVLEIRAAEEDADTLGLRVDITGERGVEYEYELGLEPVADGDDLQVYEVPSTSDGSLSLTVILTQDSAEKLRGAVLDLPSNPMQGGLVIRNPNRPDPLAGVGDLELTGDIADKVTQLLEAQINPALASHGGFATLVGVEDTKVVVTMGGGCQGCSMSAITLSEGIKTAIMSSIPEVTEVLDSTDHDAGATPYYS